MLRRPLEITQYTSYAFGKRCQEMGVVPSVGTVGDAYDNAMAESFFATQECELLDRRTFQTHSQAKLAIFEWLEGSYNPHRRHSSLGYRSPIRFEQLLRSGHPIQSLLPPKAADRAASKSIMIMKENAPEPKNLRH